MKIISWNVNGIRAAIKKGFLDYLENEDPDIICIQETKARKEQVEIDIQKYEEIWNSAERPGYAGTAIFTKKQPLSVIYDIQKNGKKLKLEDKYGDPNTEGRVLTAEFDDFYLTTVYTPNSKGDLTRLDLRYKLWDPAFLNFIKELEKSKPVIFCGDLNVAHKEIDLARPKENEGKHGFTKEEREGFDNFLKAGFSDTFRTFNQEPNQYTWWTNWGGARAKNVGWRIDYFLASQEIQDRITNAFIRPEIMGSDHCPVGIELQS
ncbi:MAG: exodeoxyribonuclease III [Candidatus Dojkabacteria bacterium]